MATWTIKRMQDICEVTSSKRIYATELVAIGVPFLKSKEIIEKVNGQENTSLLYISEQRFQEIAQQTGSIEAGDVLLTSRGTLGIPYVVKSSDRFHFADGNLTWFRRFNGLDSRYLRFFFMSPMGKAELNKCVIGSSQQAYTISALKQIKIALPGLPTQQRIADILSAYDELIENSQRRIKILESMARSLYREWFVHFRFPGHENVPHIASSLGEIPMGWEVKKLGRLAEEMRRNIRKGGLKEEQPYVGLEHIPRRSLALDAWKKTNELGSNKLEFKKGEILFGKIRPYFHKVSIAPFDGLCSADTIVIRSRQPEYYAIVVSCVSSDEFVAHATATSNGSKMPRANWHVLEEYPVVIPTLEIARQFSAVIEPSIRQMQALVFQTISLRRTRDLLLPRLLSGQINVDPSA
ncbi:hypothetical protein PspS04_03605 [Pseudomonas sp. S04]|uniref:restriction endonuclease subunit S n=1 Tax=unclassified Pseudomonas TaxID=196821 RepID=UPI0013202ABE|nr:MULTISPECIES: restriction endonuclease subunit S [unclassified Pseudomonas]QHC99498.1 hypothetical protein PspS04_03605 [Pseudomonas sp. S04]QHF31982.1 hypothetical protein PspS19_03605 [Pseudomonas sp. S19]